MSAPAAPAPLARLLERAGDALESVHRATCRSCRADAQAGRAPSTDR